MPNKRPQYWSTVCVGIVVLLFIIIGYYWNDQARTAAAEAAKASRIQSLTQLMHQYIDQADYKNADATAAELLSIQDTPELRAKRIEIDQLWLTQRLRNNVTYWKEFEKFYQ